MTSSSMKTKKVSRYPWVDNTIDGRQKSIKLAAAVAAVIVAELLFRHQMEHFYLQFVIESDQ